MMDNNQRPVTDIFLHIPKTAGTTLLKILDRQYPIAATHSFGADAHESVAQFKALAEGDKKEIRLLRGHMAFGLHEYLPQHARYFTILRDPVARVISYYNFIHRTPDHYLYGEVVGNNLSLYDLLQSELPLMMNDGQVRLLSGIWGQAPFGQVSLNMLAEAKANLRDYFVVVGLTEQFDRSLLLLKERLNWQEPIYYQRLNVTDRGQGVSKKRLPAKTLEVITQVNHQDIALYDYARELFKQQCAQMGASFAWRVRKFKFDNEYGPTLRALRTYSVRARLQSLFR